MEDALYSKKDMDNMMTKLDGLVASNDPEMIARYVSDVAAVTNTPSIQEVFSKAERREVPVLGHFSHVSLHWQGSFGTGTHQNAILVLFLTTGTPFRSFFTL